MFVNLSHYVSDFSPVVIDSVAPERCFPKKNETPVDMIPECYNIADQDVCNTYV